MGRKEYRKAGNSKSVLVELTTEDIMDLVWGQQIEYMELKVPGFDRSILETMNM